eukprot:761332-Alexandrium_andersonii.AAC.1
MGKGLNARPWRCQHARAPWTAAARPCHHLRVAAAPRGPSAMELRRALTLTALRSRGGTRPPADRPGS